MRNEQEGTQSKNELFKKGFSAGFENIANVQLIPQVAPNRHVQTYRVELSEGDIFTKIYIDTPQVADKEYSHYLLFQHLQFVPKLQIRIASLYHEKRLLAYDYIEGGDLYEQLTKIRASHVYPELPIIFQALHQIHEMSELVAQNPTIATPSEKAWPTKSPIRKGFLLPTEEQAFLNDYQIVHKRNEEAMTEFPGHYFDRNPRNLMRNERGVIQVDFGVIEKSSPLFDAAKLLRSGTDIILPKDTRLANARSSHDLIKLLSTCTQNMENQYLNHLYKLYFPNSHEDNNKLERFRHLYLFASMHAHFFYMTKYGTMLKEGRGDADKLFSRAFYHFGMAYETVQKLEAKGEPVVQLQQWLGKFIQIIED